MPGEEDPPRLSLVFRFYIYAIHGWVMEVCQLSKLALKECHSSVISHLFLKGCHILSKRYGIIGISCLEEMSKLVIERFVIDISTKGYLVLSLLDIMDIMTCFVPKVYHVFYMTICHIFSRWYFTSCRVGMSRFVVKV